MSASTKVTYTSVAGSVAIDALTKQIFDTANQLLKLPQFGGEVEAMTCLQGSYRPRTSYSGTTHTGCGVADMTAFNPDNRIRILDLLGHVASHRYPWQGKWGPHIHGVTNGMGCVAVSAQQQIVDIKHGGDGLVGPGQDLDKKLRSGLWPLAVYLGRKGVLTPTRPTRTYDGPSYKRKVMGSHLPGISMVNAIMEVNVNGSRWFVTDRGVWGFSGKWRLA